MWRLAASFALLAGLMFWGPPEETFFWNSLFDVGHAVVFAALMWLALGIAAAVGAESTTPRNLAGAFLAVVLIGVLTEVVQLFDPRRDASVSDLLRDVAGALIVMVVSAPQELLGGWSVARAGRWVAVIAIAVATAWPLWVATGVYAQRRTALPVVVSFAPSEWTRRFLTVRDAVLEQMDGGQARLALEKGEYPGFALREPYPDWEGYGRLLFTAVGDSTGPIELTLRIHDRQHNGAYDDRFNRAITIQPGRQEIVIALDDVRNAPRDRLLDLAEVRGVAVFAYRLDRPVILGLSDFRLE